MFIQDLEVRSESIEDIGLCARTPAAGIMVPEGDENEICVLKNQLLESARRKLHQAPVKQIDFETANEYQEKRPSLKSLKAHLQYVKCGSVEWQRQDMRVSKEIFHATWLFSEKSQMLVVERRQHHTADRYRLLVPFQAIAGLRFNSSTDTIAAHVKRLPELQAQVLPRDGEQGTWTTHEDYTSLSSRASGREMLSLTLQFIAEKTSLSEMQQQFERQPSLAKTLNVGINAEFKYENVNTSRELQDLHRNMPIIMDPTLVRAAQKADIEVLNEAKEKGNDVRFLVKMYCGLEDSFNEQLRIRVQSAKASSFRASV